MTTDHDATLNIPLEDLAVIAWNATVMASQLRRRALDATDPTIAARLTAAADKAAEIAVKRRARLMEAQS